MAVQDQQGWTWGGLLKGAAKIVGYAVVGLAVATGVSMGLAALGFTGVASFLTGTAVTTATPISAIPGLIMNNIGTLLTPAAEAVTGAAGSAVDTVKDAAASAGQMASDAAGATVETVKGAATSVAEGAKGLANEYGTTAAAAAGASAVAGGYMYLRGKDAGKREVKGKFTQMLADREAAAGLNPLQRG